MSVVAYARRNNHRERDKNGPMFPMRPSCFSHHGRPGRGVLPGGIAVRPCVRRAFGRYARGDSSLIKASSSAFKFNSIGAEFPFSDRPSAMRLDGAISCLQLYRRSSVQVCVHRVVHETSRSEVRTRSSVVQTALGVHCQIRQSAFVWVHAEGNEQHLSILIEIE